MKGAPFQVNESRARATNVRIDRSQYPDAVRQDLLESLRTRKANHKFHYDSIKQTQKWLALHEAYSPARTDPDCEATYVRAFREVSQSFTQKEIEVVSLGCGGGQKDFALIAELNASGLHCTYVPTDVSVAMTLVAHERLSAIAKSNSLVFDLATVADLPGLLGPSANRLIACFGMLPNFEPNLLLSKLSSALGHGEHVLLSANLSPGADYAAGVRQVLPLYDNQLTREWLSTFLFDLGVQPADGAIEVSIQADPTHPELLRIQADFVFKTQRTIRMEGERFEFQPGQRFQLFFSYRYNQPLLNKLLAEFGFNPVQWWITPSAEEAVILCERQSA